MSQDEVAAALDEIGTLLQLKGENDFRTRAYHNAARTLSQFSGDLKQLVADKKLNELPGIGDGMQKRITELVTTGKLKELDDLRGTVPPGLIEMLRIPSLGPKKAKALWDDLDVDSIAKLQAACESGEVAKLKGFGEKTQTKILEGLRFLGTVGNRVRFDQAFALGQVLLEQLRALPGVIRSELCGSLRRRRETAKDVDIVVSSDDPQPIMDAFVKFPQVMQVVAHGPSKSSVVASVDAGGRKVILNADLRVVTDEQFPVTIVHFTGSKDHNIQLRQRAIERGWSLNDFALTGEKGAFPIKDEEALYKKLGLKWIPPEMREATGEVELAETTIPTLIELSDLRGVFHNHTTASDGAATLEEMAKAAKKLGLEYFGVGDHSQSLTVANGLSPERVRQQWAEIDALNKKLKGIRILKGTECDILLDGSLDFDDELLAGFEYVVASVHSHFGLSEEEQTERVCKALSHPAVTMLGHATGRLLLRREGYKLNIERVLQAAAKHGKMIEINAQPDRLDLDWTHVKRAKALGIPLVINPDAHHPDDIALIQYGINVARRGWLTAADVFNTRSVGDVVKELARRKKG